MFGICLHHFLQRVPHPCVLCKGGRRCCLNHFVEHEYPTKLAQAFPTPAIFLRRQSTFSRLPLVRFGCKATVDDVLHVPICLSGAIPIGLLSLIEAGHIPAAFDVVHQ